MRRGILHCYSTISFLSSCIPGLYPHLPTVIQLQSLRGELYCNCRHDVCRRFITDECVSDVGLARGSITNKDDWIDR